MDQVPILFPSGSQRQHSCRNGKEGMQLWDDRLSGDDLQNYKDLVAFFYTNIKGETAKERLSILFSNEQIKRLGKANRISLL